MKQAESDKILNKLLKETAKRFDWKYSRGFVFKKENDIFFTIIVDGVPKSNRLFWSLSFKHFDFDDIFWDVVQLPENKKKTLSFRACGAWVTPSLEAQSEHKILDIWDESLIASHIEKIFETYGPLSQNIASAVDSYLSNMQVMEKYYAQLKNKYPKALRTLWAEKLLTCLLESKYTEAKDIATARIEAGDVGGFNYKGRSFYQLAIEFINNKRE